MSKYRPEYQNKIRSIFTILTKQFECSFLDFSTWLPGTQPPFVTLKNKGIYTFKLFSAI